MILVTRMIDNALARPMNYSPGPVWLVQPGHIQFDLHFHKKNLISHTGVEKKLPFRFLSVTKQECNNIIAAKKKIKYF